MKKIIVASAMVLGLFTASAQTKIGYINTEELLGSMPEAVTVSKELEEYGASLDMQREEYIKELNEKGEKFNTDSAKLSASMKEIKRKELQDLYEKIQGWQQTAQEDMNRKSQEKLMPLRKKAMDAINTVAKENGYTYVLDISTIIVGPPTDNIIGLVKKKLGIKEPAASPAAKPAGAK
jgi:outer membrane protein